MCDGEDRAVEDAEDVITIVKRIDRRLRKELLHTEKPAMIDPDVYEDPAKEEGPGPEEPSLEVAKRLLQQAEVHVHNQEVAEEYREQARVWMAIHEEENKRW